MTAWSQKKSLFVYPWQELDAARVFARLAAQPYSLYLDSARPSHPLNRYSYLCWHPFETIESKDGRVTITNRENQFTYKADPFQVVRERLALWGDVLKHDPALPPFQGGAVGFFGYDLARGLEKISTKAKDSQSMPDLCIGLYDKVLAFDHAAGKAWLILHMVDEKTALTHKAYLEGLAHETPARTDFQPEWKTQIDDCHYRADIQKVIDYIYAGDIFQANLSRRFTADVPGDFDSYAHYCHLRAVNAAPYAAYMNFGGIKLASSSPERFLSVEGRKIETRPIKGTLSSSLPAEFLENSEKDRAENAMIVDLLRNDLSKVCEDHSVTVDEFCSIETFEAVHHMVSTISGTLRADQTPLDALRACFPGGSITGAPKIRAMEIIEELEPHRRGPYCGAMGYIGWNGTMDTSITIRTIVYDGAQMHIQTGGGITADSIPEAELNETLTKAAKLFESFAPIQTKDQVA
jgi:para-aminobenzoate synthetase component I